MRHNEISALCREALRESGIATTLEAQVAFDGRIYAFAWSASRDRVNHLSADRIKEEFIRSIWDDISDDREAFQGCLDALKDSEG